MKYETPPLLPDPLPTCTVTCADCGAAMKLRTGRYGLFWSCGGFPNCLGIHGAHDATGLPLGIPAKAETRAARTRAHDAFDKLWNYGEHGRKTRRRKAYVWLAQALGVEDAHIGDLDLAGCERVIALCEGVDPSVLDTIELGPKGGR